MNRREFVKTNGPGVSRAVGASGPVDRVTTVSA